MGLSEEEVAERFRTVTSKVQKVTESMVTCDTKYRDKLDARSSRRRWMHFAKSWRLGASRWRQGWQR